MPIDERWQRLGPSDWAAFAQAWLTELRHPSSNGESNVRLDAVWMSFSATPEQQWEFILAAITHSESDEELGHIAAGPIEHLLGWHGEKYIDRVEHQAAIDAKFGRALTGVWKYLMKDEVWARVQAFQGRIPNPLPAYLARVAGTSKESGG
jgi:hypothetical protein